jgi:hypothetical protein
MRLRMICGAWSENDYVKRLVRGSQLLSVTFMWQSKRHETHTTEQVCAAAMMMKINIMDNCHWQPSATCLAHAQAGCVGKLYVREFMVAVDTRYHQLQLLVDSLQFALVGL